MANKALFMETTMIAPEKTAGEITSLLVEAGARQISMEYDEAKRPIGTSFILAIDAARKEGGDMPCPATRTPDLQGRSDAPVPDYCETDDVATALRAEEQSGAGASAPPIPFYQNGPDERCRHEYLDMDGICRSCGTDCRGGSL